MINSNHSVILISPYTFYTSFKKAGIATALYHYETYSAFFTKHFSVVKDTIPEEVSLHYGSNITRYYEKSTILKNQIEDYVFWIVEQPRENYYYLFKNLVMLRWLRLKNPVLVSSFVNFPDLGEIKEGGKSRKNMLKPIFGHKCSNDYFLRLPVLIEELIQWINTASERDCNNYDITYEYLAHHRLWIEHELKNFQKELIDCYHKM